MDLIARFVSGLWLLLVNTSYMIVWLMCCVLVCCAGTSLFVYFVCGFFGAALFGREAYRIGNILENDLGSGLAQGALNIFYTVYLILRCAFNDFPPIAQAFFVVDDKTSNQADGSRAHGSTPPTEYVARATMLKWWAALAVHVPVLNVSPQLRKVTVASLIYGGCLCVSVKYPDKSSQVRRDARHDACVSSWQIITQGS